MIKTNPVYKNKRGSPPRSVAVYVGAPIRAFSRAQVAGIAPLTQRVKSRIQGNLAHKKHLPRRTQD